MGFSMRELASMVDISAVRAESDETEIRAMVEFAREYQCLCAFTLPCHVPLVTELLADEPSIMIGGVVGFPSGGVSSKTKMVEAGELICLGCNELDMVINLGLLLSGQYQRVEDDIRRVVDVAEEVPVKVVLECHYLSEDDIRKGCDLSINGGASFVKTGTGWAPTGATIENVGLIKSHVGDAIGIKAAGGLSDLDTLCEMNRIGAQRFGLGLKNAAGIFEQCLDNCDANLQKSMGGRI